MMRKVSKAPPRLADRPGLFSFDAAVRLLLLRRRKRRVSDAIVLRAAANLAYPAADVVGVVVGRGLPELVVGIPGLAGANGPLPWHYSGTIRDGGRRLRALIDLLSSRFLAALAEAGIKYRLDRAVETARIESGTGRSQHEIALLAAAGFADVDLDSLVPQGALPLLAYARLFAQQPRTTAGMAALAGDWLGVPVRVVEFTGRWVAIAPDQRTRLPRGRRPGAYTRLGLDAAVGERIFDAQSRLTLRLGPLTWPDFCALLPGGERLAQLKTLTRAYLGLSQGFDVQPVLAAAQVPMLRLSASASPGPRLSRTTWLCVSHAKRRRDADDALFAG
jgi:type VI secretion system protein ImpH